MGSNKRAGSASKVRIDKFEDLFGGSAEQESSAEQIINAPLTDLHTLRRLTLRHCRKRSVKSYLWLRTAFYAPPGRSICMKRSRRTFPVTDTHLLFPGSLSRITGGSLLKMPLSVPLKSPEIRRKKKRKRSCRNCRKDRHLTVCRRKSASISLPRRSILQKIYYCRQWNVPGQKIWVMMWNGKA